jgi:predicted protein tyrosine phosphatase
VTIHVEILGLKETAARLAEPHRRRWDAIVSIVDPSNHLVQSKRPPRLDLHASRVLCLDFDDTEYDVGEEGGVAGTASWMPAATKDDYIGPTLAHAQALVDFTKEALGMWPRPGTAARAMRWLFHCHAGTSRSTAAALYVLGAHYGFDDPSLGRRLKEIRPKAEPNRLFLKHLDDIVNAAERPQGSYAPSADPVRRLLEQGEMCWPEGVPRLIPWGGR